MCGAIVVWNKRTGKKGSIPVTVFVLLVIVVFAFALLAFSLATRSAGATMADRAAFVAVFSERLAAESYLERDTAEMRAELITTRGSWKWLGKGEHVLEVSVNVRK